MGSLVVEGRCVSRSSEGFIKELSKIAQKYPQNLFLISEGFIHVFKVPLLFLRNYHSQIGHKNYTMNSWYHGLSVVIVGQEIKSVIWGNSVLNEIISLFTLVGQQLKDVLVVFKNH